jgi:hypothetical protein
MHAKKCWSHDERRNVQVVVGHFKDWDVAVGRLTDSLNKNNYRRSGDLQ